MKCNKCAEGNMVERDGKFGKFMACDNYPECKHTEQIKAEDKIETVKMSSKTSELDKQKLIVRMNCLGHAIKLMTSQKASISVDEAMKIGDMLVEWVYGNN